MNETKLRLKMNLWMQVSVLFDMEYRINKIIKDLRELWNIVEPYINEEKSCFL